MQVLVALFAFAAASVAQEAFIGANEHGDVLISPAAGRAVIASNIDVKAMFNLLLTRIANLEMANARTAGECCGEYYCAPDQRGRPPVGPERFFVDVEDISGAPGFAQHGCGEPDASHLRAAGERHQIHRIRRLHDLVCRAERNGQVERDNAGRDGWRLAASLLAGRSA